MREEETSPIGANDYANPDAAQGVPTPETKDGGSGSADCSFSAIGLRLVEFKQTYWVRLDGESYYPQKPEAHSGERRIETKAVEHVIAAVDPYQVIAVTSSYSPKSTMDYCTLVLNGGAKIEVPYSVQEAVSMLNSCATISGFA